MHVLLYILNDICGGGLQQAVMQDIECNNLQRQTSDNTALYFSLLKNYLQLCFSIQLTAKQKITTGEYLSGSRSYALVLCTHIPVSVTLDQLLSSYQVKMHD
jgi:hypothetical protein